MGVSSVREGNVLPLLMRKDDFGVGMESGLAEGWSEPKQGDLLRGNCRNSGKK